MRQLDSPLSDPDRPLQEESLFSTSGSRTWPSPCYAELRFETGESTARWAGIGVGGEGLEKLWGTGAAGSQGDRTDIRIRTPRCAAF